MKKGCLIAIVGVVGFFVLLTIIGVVASLFVSDSEEITEGKKPDSALESAKAEPAKSGDSKPTKSKPAKESFAEHYSIISDKPTGTVKRSVDVRLKEKVSEETLEGIAKEIRASNPRKFERTFIVYYLPEQTVGAGGWATSHFNPTLEVNVLGLSADSETATVAKEGETEIGRWEYSAPPGFVAVVLKTEKGVTIRRVFGDGSSSDEEMTASQKGGEIVLTPVEENDFGEHWIVGSDGSLQLMDKDGLIGKAVATGKKTKADELHAAFGLSEEPKEKVATIFDPRTWTSADGQRTFFGKLTKLENGNVTVEKDGEPITFAIAKLSPADREFLGQGVSITTLDGTTHENGSVARISADSILFKKDSGPVTIAMENLPETLRQRFGYDPEIAAELKRAKEKQLAVMRERQATAAAQQSAQDNLDSFMAVLKAAGVGNELVTKVSTKGETVSVTVANGWHYQPKQVRQQSAQILWQTWAMIYAPNDLDKARLSLRDSVGNEVGGSRWLAGSLIWVDD